MQVVAVLDARVNAMEGAWERELGPRPTATFTFRGCAKEGPPQCVAAVRDRIPLHSGYSKILVTRQRQRAAALPHHRPCMAA